jgi:CheY-like chemotaxis protein
MADCVLLREDDRDLIQLVHELLEDQGYTIVDVVSLEDLLVEATRRGPCVA